MIMRKLFISALALTALFAVSCNKEFDNPAEPAGRPISIRATLDDATRTAYEGEKTFSWVAGDKISLKVIKDDDQTMDVITLTTNESGTSVTFSGSLPDGYTASTEAFYPKGTGSDYYSSDLALQKESGHLRTWGTITPDLANPMGSIPLIGQEVEEGTFAFKTCTGIVKFTVSNIPGDTYFFCLDAPEGTALNGNFSYGDDCTLYMENAEYPWPQKYVYYTPEADGETRDFYLPIPVGTIPAGSTVSVTTSSQGKIVLATTVKDIEVVRNKVIRIPAVAVPAAATYTLDDVLGTYEMTVSSIGYSTNNTPGLLVIAASDDSAKGNVMITMFAGIAGKEYGTFDGTKLVFPADQLFAANPYPETQADYPYIALDAYTGGVTDCVFNVLGPGHIKYVGDALGFRATTEELWYNDNHNGAWPWSLGFGSVDATWVDDTLTDIALSNEMISVNVEAGSRDGLVLYDGQGKAALVDGDITTFWHSPWATGETIMAWYGPEGQYGTTFANYTADQIYDYNDLDPVYGAYIDINLGQLGIQDFQLRFCLRNNGGNHAKHVLVYGSTDGITWGDALSEVENVCSGINQGEWINWIDCQSSAPVSFLRLSIIENTSGIDLRDPSAQGCVHMAELELRYRM